MTDEIQLPLADGATCTVRRECLVISKTSASANSNEIASITVSEGDASFMMKLADFNGKEWRRKVRQFGIGLISSFTAYAISSLMKLEIGGQKIENLFLLIFGVWTLLALVRFIWFTKSPNASESQTPLIQRDDLLRLEWSESELLIYYRLGKAEYLRRLKPLERQKAEVALRQLSWL